MIFFHSLLITILIIIYCIGFLCFFMKNAICSCQEHFFFFGFVQSFFWFIVTPYRIIRDKINDISIECSYGRGEF